MFKSNKGYSLIEIGVGVIILTVFLIFSIGLFNGCYTYYRKIKARNLAMDRAIFHIENMLQADSDELTGFIMRDEMGNRYPSVLFKQYVHDNFSSFESRYNNFNGGSSSDVPGMNSVDLSNYILYDKDYLIDSFINYCVSSPTRTTDEQLKNGSYCFLDDDKVRPEYKVVLDNASAFDVNDNAEYINSNNGAIRVVKCVNRIPAEYGKAYGNNVLLLKVVVYYTHEFSRNMKEEDMSTITIEAVKATY